MEYLDYDLSEDLEEPKRYSDRNVSNKTRKDVDSEFLLEDHDDLRDEDFNPDRKPKRRRPRRPKRRNYDSNGKKKPKKHCRFTTSSDDVIDLTNEPKDEEHCSIIEIEDDPNDHQEHLKKSSESIIPSIDEIMKWTTEDVVKWLKSINLSIYESNFRRNHVSGKVLLELTKEDLQNDLQIQSLGHRKDILREIDKLKGTKQPLKESSDSSNQSSLQMHRQVAKGSFGVVWFVCWNGIDCAAKVIQTSDLHPEVLRRVKEEVNILSRLNHECIVRYLGDEERSNELHIFMEYLPTSLYSLFQDLRVQQKCLTPKQIHFLARSIARALQYLHELDKPVIHRDIKSKNVSTSISTHYTHLHEGDFGVSKVISETTMANTYLGTYRWISPEILSRKQDGYTSQTDIWSFGMVIYELITMRNPYFEIVDSEEISKRILNGIPPSLPAALPRSLDPFVELMKKCLKVEPSERLSARETVEYLDALTDHLDTLENLPNKDISDTESTFVL